MSGADNEIRHALRTAGIPERYYSVTLPDLSCSDLREHFTVEDQIILTLPEGVGCIYLYSTKGGRAKARSAFYVLAKELVLSGYTVNVVSLCNILDYLSNDNAPIESAAKDFLPIGSDLLFVSDFYETGPPSPMDGRMGNRVRRFFRSLNEFGVCLCLLSDSKNADPSWYPESFIEELQNDAIVYCVGR